MRDSNPRTIRHDQSNRSIWGKLRNWRESLRDGDNGAWSSAMSLRSLHFDKCWGQNEDLFVYGSDYMSLHFKFLISCRWGCIFKIKWDLTPTHINLRLEHGYKNDEKFDRTDQSKFIKIRFKKKTFVTIIFQKGIQLSSWGAWSNCDWSISDLSIWSTCERTRLRSCLTGCESSTDDLTQTHACNDQQCSGKNIPLEQ